MTTDRSSDDQHHLKEPQHLKADDPGPCPRPSGCKCNWSAGSIGWFRGYVSRCGVHDS